MHSEYCNLCFSELCDRYMLGTDREDNEKYMTVLNSINCIFCWCQSKNIPVDHFIWELVSVMNRIHFKKNCFCLVGETNAGKTFIIKRSLHAIVRFAGEVGAVSSGSPFAWQDCTNEANFLPNTLTN